jgi:hypothetical protein
MVGLAASSAASSVFVAEPRMKSTLSVIEKLEMTLSFLMAGSVTVRPAVAAPVALMWTARRYCSAVSATLPAETSATSCSVSAASS